MMEFTTNVNKYGVKFSISTIFECNQNCHVVYYTTVSTGHIVSHFMEKENRNIQIRFITMSLVHKKT